MRFLHTMLRVRNLDTAMKFYRDAMGLKEVRRIDNDKGRFTLVFLCAPEDVDTLKKLPQTRGAPLAGLAVKVTSGFFLVGLSAVEGDMQRNLQLLKERPWFDIPIVYNNNRRAILAMEKGTPGEKAFNEAFASWRQ